MHFGSDKIKKVKESLQAVKDVLQMFHCNYEGLDRFMDIARDAHNRILVRNERVFSQLENKTAYTKQFLTEACKTFPFQVAKLNRLHLSFAEEILKDVTLNLRMLFLFRDPRGLINSRLDVLALINKTRDNATKVLDKLQKSESYYSPTVICKNLIQDLKAAKELIQKYPTRFTVVRYEDFAVHVFDKAPALFNTMGLPFHNQVLEFIKEHTGRKDGNVYSTFRNANNTVFRWTTDFNFEQVDYMQKSCWPALKLGGYLEATSEDELVNNFIPLDTSEYNIYDYFNELDKIN